MHKISKKYHNYFHHLLENNKKCFPLVFHRALVENQEKLDLVDHVDNLDLLDQEDPLEVLDQVDLVVNVENLDLLDNLDHQA